MRCSQDVLMWAVFLFLSSLRTAVDTNLQLVEHWNLLKSMNLWHSHFSSQVLIPSSFFSLSSSHKWKCWNVENLFSNTHWREDEEGKRTNETSSMTIECESEIVNWKMSRMCSSPLFGWRVNVIQQEIEDCVVCRMSREGFSENLWTSFTTHFYSVLTFL